MIINIRGLLNKVRSLKTTSNKVDFKMAYDNGSYTPTFSADEGNKIEIPPYSGDGTLVGLAIISEDKYILTNNGLMVKRDSCRATDVLLFSTWEDAVNFCQEFNKFVQLSSISRITIYAAYQHKSKENSLLFKQVSVPFMVM